MRSTDLIPLFADVHAVFPPLGGRCPHSPLQRCLLLRRVEMKAARGEFYKADQEKVFEIQHNFTIQMSGDPPHGQTLHLIILKCSTEQIITDFPYLIEALTSNAKVQWKIDVRKVNQKHYSV